MSEERRFEPRALLAALEEAEALYVVIGGTAAVIHGATHLTFNLDVTPERSLENLDRVAEALRELGARVYGVPEGTADFFQLDRKPSRPARRGSS